MINNKHINNWFLLGLLACMAIYLPMIILNADLRVIIHDELDGELLTYIMQARHLFDDSIPELFDGAAKSSLTPPAAGLVLLFYFLPAKWALFLSYMLIVFVAYFGMYYCVKELLDNKWIAAVTGVLFASLPFYPVYGLSVMGQPLLIAALLMLYSNKHKVLAYLMIAFFIINSSLILVGYADICLLTCFIIEGLLRKKSNIKYVLAGWFELVVGYMLTNTSLIGDVLFSQGNFKSHKEEYIVPSAEPLAKFKSVFAQGAYHVEARHQIILIVSLVLLIITGILYNRLGHKEKEVVKLLRFAVAITVIIAGISALFGWGPVVEFRNHIGGPILYFQLDRFYWLYPAIWYLIFALSVFLIYSIFPQKKILICIIVGINLLYILHGSTVSANFRLLTRGWNVDLGHESVDEFYQPELFEQAEALMGNKNSYKVCSIGLYPSIPLYNGFNCLDGYSNNYSLSYKHEFRKIIEKELDKNPELKDYYDNWGNRCYIFSNELGKSYYVYKEQNAEINSLELDFSKMSEMGCRYIFSAVPINGVQELELVDMLSSDDSVYDLYIYRIV